MRVLMKFSIHLFVWAMIISSSACAPAMVRFQPGEIPAESALTAEDVSMGEQGRQVILSQAYINNEPRYTKRLEHILSRIFGVVSSESHWKVYVVQSDEWNAMTTPGNYIYVHTGIMDDLEDDGELAAVLSHEIAHRLARHHDKTMEELLAGMMLELGAATVAVGMEEKGKSRADIEKAVALTAEVLSGFTVNPYSQARENEADLIGLFIMADAGFNPNKAAKVWFEQAKKNPDQDALAFFSTHPASSDRYRRMLDNMSLAEGRFRQSSREQHSIATARASTELHQHIPTVEAQHYYFQGNTLFDNYHLAEAAQYFQAAVASDKKFVEPRNMLAISFVKMGDILSAKKILQDATHISPYHGSSHYNLACVHALGGENELALQELKKALKLDPTFKRLANKDSDLFSLRQDPRFMKLINATGGATFQINMP